MAADLVNAIPSHVGFEAYSEAIATLMSPNAPPPESYVRAAFNVNQCAGATVYAWQRDGGALPTVYVLATAINGTLGASVWGSPAEALDAGAEWARTWFAYEGEADLDAIRAHLAAYDMSAPALDVIETTGVL